MRELANVLYVTRYGLSLSLDHDAVKVTEKKAMVARFPLLNLAGIVLFGGIHVTSALIHRCADEGRDLVWLDHRGRFRARLQGVTKGNVLLRQAQHDALSDAGSTIKIARQMVAGKIQNSRQVLLRGIRDASEREARKALESGGHALARGLESLESASDLDVIRGIEGDAARNYFALMPYLVTSERRDWTSGLRIRRPPGDRFNALLSFVYALLRIECESALEGVGLDPQVGYLHALRPGRSSLALDLMEEIRPIADRLVLTLVNRRQVGDADFEETPKNSVYLSGSGRKAVVAAYQKRKEVEVPHYVLGNKTPIGLIPHIQARLLARHIRGDLAHYPPFLYR